MVLFLSFFVDEVVIGWQLTTYQAAEGIPTVQACAEVLSGAANISARTITLQVSTNPNTAQGRHEPCSQAPA